MGQSLRTILNAKDYAALDAALKAKGVTPGLAVVLVGDDPAKVQRLMIQAWSLVHGLAMLMLDGQVPAEPALIDAVAAELQRRSDCVMSTAAHAIDRHEDWVNPNVVKVVTDIEGTALYFSRAPLPWWRDAPATPTLPSPAPLRHVGIYGYRAGFLRRFPALAPSPQEQLESLEQLRVLWHGGRIAVHVTPHAPGPGVDTPQDLERVRRALHLLDFHLAAEGQGAVGPPAPRGPPGGPARP